MTALHRREMLLGGALAIVAFPACPAHAQASGGCWLDDAAAVDFAHNGSASATARDEIVATSGVADLELALLQTLDMLSGMFGVLPGFSFYKEGGRPNAKATKVDLTKTRPDGTVLLGTALLRDLLALPLEPAAAVVAVVAHEFGHILSFSNGMIRELRPRREDSPFRAEQFADFMSGYFAGVRKLKDPDFPAVIFADSASHYGGRDHGTGEQRAEAIVAGFNRGFVARDQPVAATQRALAFSLSRSG